MHFEKGNKRILTTNDLLIYTFELIQDELYIDNIEELYINASRVGEDQNNSWLGRNLDVVMVKKINELVQALKQINQNKED